MADKIDSFVLKFKNFWSSGQNANLVIQSNAGKASVTLSVCDLHVPEHVQERILSRNGPAKQRRRERRAAAKKATEEVAADNRENAEVIDLNKGTEKVETKPKENNAKPAEKVAKVDEKTNLRLCSVQLFPEENVNIENFRENVENYFKAKYDVV